MLPRLVLTTRGNPRERPDAVDDVHHAQRGVDVADEARHRSSPCAVDLDACLSSDDALEPLYASTPELERLRAVPRTARRRWTS